MKNLILSLLITATAWGAAPGGITEPPLVPTTETFTYDAYYNPSGTTVTVDKPDPNLVAITVNVNVNWAYDLFVDNLNDKGPVDYSITYYSGATVVLPTDTLVYNTTSTFNTTLAPSDDITAVVSSTNGGVVKYTDPALLNAWINNLTIPTRFTATTSDSCSGSCAVSTKYNSASKVTITVTYEYLDCGCSDPDNDGDCEDIEHKHRKHKKKEPKKKKK